MLNPLRKIGLIIFLILILPISAFFIYQFASLNESEQEINKIYTQQLEAILYSINQYSEDVVSSWVNDISTILSLDKNQHENKFKELLDENYSISTMFISDTNFTNLSIFSNLSSNEKNILQDSIRKTLSSKRLLIDRLQNFYKSNYQKIEPLGKFTSSNLHLSLFLLNPKENEKFIGGVIFNPTQFIKQKLSSKISQTAGDKFVLAVLNNNKNTIVHSTESISIDKIILKKPLWLLPNLALGIQMKSGSIQQLTSQRFYKNIIILGLLLIVLIVGFGLIFFNLKKEIRLTQLKTDFISNVSHELRTPLSLISMYSETLVLDRIKTEDKKKEYYSVIYNETNRLSKIVNSILNFSKMEAGTRKYDFKNHSLIDISNEVLSTYDYHIKSKGFTYTSKNEKNIENIIVDKDAASESIINLIENAIKYSSDKKKIEISIDKNSQGPFWEIKDFGIGISQEDQLKIFDKFYRVSSGLVHNTKGTGLGLSLVKEIMEAHNGEVTVISSTSFGSTFRLQFNKNFNDKNSMA
ncbi:MAG: HAMP domain-containing histidine kinase [Ignavibacteriae bacterium]|nr:HAMP domain-containing histidine kinase [Ignavibacteriota bacterium]